MLSTEIGHLINVFVNLLSFEVVDNHNFRNQGTLEIKGRYWKRDIIFKFKAKLFEIYSTP